MAETLRFTRGNLPHWLVADHTYFLTLRLAGTLPKSVVAELETERAVLLKNQPTEDARTALARRQFLRIESSLHAVDNTRDWLTRPGIPEIILDNLNWLADQKRGWLVHAATVLSNHVHLLLRNTAGHSEHLLGDIGNYKIYVATRINRLLGRTGALWAREGFDHWCRDDDKVRNAARYICDNPVKAGLVKHWAEWPWTRCVEWLRPESEE